MRSSMRLTPQSVSISQYWREAWGNIRRSGRKLIEFELLFALMSAGVIVPLSGLVLNHLINRTGNVAITNYDLMAFALSPYGILFILVTLCSSFTLFFTQRAGVTILAASVVHDRPVGPIRSLVFALGRLPVFLRLGGIYALGLLLASLPFIIAGTIVAYFLLQRHDINYYLYHQPTEWFAFLGCSALLALGYAVLAIHLWARSILALTVIVSERRGAISALRCSWQMTTCNERFIVKAAGGWWLLLTALIFPLNRAISALADYGLDHVTIGLSAEVVVVSLVAALIFILSAAWSLLGMSGEALIIQQLYRESGGQLASLERLERNAAARQTALSVKLVGTVLIAVFTVMLAAGLYNLADEPKPDQILITAHRAGAVRGPENTLAALRQAIAEHADYAEIDVQTSADGQLVVLHDADLMRIANDPRKVSELSTAQIQAADAGSWHSAAFVGESVPLLSEMLDLARNQIGLNIELKYNRPDPLLAEKVVALLQQENMTQQVVITSLDARAIEEVRQRDPSIATGLIVTTAIGDPSRTDTQFLAINQSVATEKFIARAHKSGKQIHVWTVNNPKQMIRMLALGADVLITDHPQEAVAIRAEWLALSPIEQTALRLRYLF